MHVNNANAELEIVHAIHMYLASSVSADACWWLGEVKGRETLGLGTGGCTTAAAAAADSDNDDMT